jgi:hypothetical protein
MVTDIGIELGKALYVNRTPGQPRVRADWGKVRLLSSLVALFISGGTLGALGFKHFGFVMTLPLAAILLCLASVSVLDDVKLAPRRIAVGKARAASRVRDDRAVLSRIRGIQDGSAAEPSELG